MVSLYFGLVDIGPVYFKEARNQRAKLYIRPGAHQTENVTFEGWDRKYTF